MQELEGKVALVTGGGSGIGRALALECANRGMHVVVADIEAEPAERVAAEVRELGMRSLAQQADVSQRAAVDALAERAYAQFGQVNLLFANAGVSIHRPLAEAREQDWGWLLSVNLWGTIHTVDAFVQRMRRQPGDAHIVVTASMSGLLARRNNRGIYTTTKHGLVGFTNVLRDELEPEGIGVSCFCPGGMLTRGREGGRNRQAQFGGPFVPEGLQGEREPNPMLPEGVAPRVLEGVRRNLRYIFSHPHTRAQVQAYYDQIFADFDAAEDIVKEVG